MEIWRGGGGVSKAKIVKGKYGFQMEIPGGEGGGGLRKNPFCGGGMDNFWKHTSQFRILEV